MEYHNFVPITADLTGAADAYNQCHYQVSPLKSGYFWKKWIFFGKSGYFLEKVDIFWKKWIFFGKSGYFLEKVDIFGKMGTFGKWIFLEKVDIFECIWEDGLTGLELKRVCWIWLAWINQIHTIKLFIIWYKYKIQFSTRNEPNCIIRDSNRIVRGSIQLKVELMPLTSFRFQYLKSHGFTGTNFQSLSDMGLGVPESHETELHGESFYVSKSDSEFELTIDSVSKSMQGWKYTSVCVNSCSRCSIISTKHEFAFIRVQYFKKIPCSCSFISKSMYGIMFVSEPELIQVVFCAQLVFDSLR